MQLQDEVARARLAAMLAERRSALGFSTKLKFAHARGFANEQIISAVERGRRTKLSDRMVERLESAYQWEPGSIARVLAGEPPQEAADQAEIVDAARALLASAGDSYSEAALIYLNDATALNQALLALGHMQSNLLRGDLEASRRNMVEFYLPAFFILQDAAQKAQQTDRQLP